MAPSVIIDSASSQVSYSGSQWQSGFDPSTYGGSFNTCRTDTNSSSTTSAPKLSLSFTGSAIQFYGQPTNDLKLNYTYDGSRALRADTAFTPDIPGKTGIRLWGIRNVTSTYHRISLIPISGQPIFDYAVVTPTSSTSLRGEILALDDTDPLIKYNGTWTSEFGTRFDGGLSYNDTRRGTNRSGASFSVQFVGASVAVYGLLNQQSGTLSSTYSIDGGTPVTYVAYNGAQPTSPNTWAIHQQFFNTDVLPGNHTLTVAVTEVTGSQTFWLDYVTFEGISSTTLTPIPTSKESGSSSLSLTKIVTSVVVTFIVLVVFISCLKTRCKRRIRKMFSAPPPPYTPPAFVEVPTRPMPPRQPPHLSSQPFHHETSPAIIQLQRDVEALRQENARMYALAPAPQPPPHMTTPGLHIPPGIGNPQPFTGPPSLPTTTPGFIADGGDTPRNGDQVLHPNTYAPSPPTPTTGPQPPPSSPNNSHSGMPSSTDPAELQREIDRLREENERMRNRPLSVQQPVVDAGPADAPPPYSDANYIP